MSARYRIAGRVVEVCSLHGFVHDYCAGFRTQDPADFTVVSTQEAIERERRASAAQDARDGVPLRAFSDGYLESLAVYRQIAERMLEWDILLFHGSVLALDGEGYLFAARSGTGKSTHARLWRERFGSRVTMVNDDKPLLHVGADGVVAYGTPWMGKHRLGANTSAPLRAICLLRRGTQTHVEPVDPAQGLPLLLPHAYRPDDRALMGRTLELVDGICRHVRLYRLTCTMDPSAAQIAWEGMQ